MSLEQPELFQKIDYVNKDVDYEWTEENTEQSISQQIINQKLLDLICQLNYKAAFGFGAAAGEWVFWRFLNWRPKRSGKDLALTFQANYAHWLGLIDKYYIHDLKNSNIYKDMPKDGIEPPFWVVQSLIGQARFNYIKTRPTLYGNVTRLLTLARYISTEEKLFDDWFKECYTRAQKIFPNQQWPIWEELSRSNMDESYDSNNDLFIPREFYFSKGFDYESADLISMQQDLLELADYKTNIFLSKPDDMIKDGFQGIPYQYSAK